VGLTNRPFLEGMAEVALSSGGTVYLHNKENPTVDPKQLAQMLGLPADTPESVILAKAAEFKQLAERAPAADQVVLSAEDHRVLLDAKAKSDADAEDARKALRDARLDGWVKDGKLMPAQREVMALAYDADPDKVSAQFDAMQAHPGFKPAGGEGEALPGTDADDAQLSHSQLLHKTVERLRSQDPTLTYPLALARAYEVVGEKRPHVLQALAGRA
jgi:phage I-like protein